MRGTDTRFQPRGFTPLRRQGAHFVTLALIAGLARDVAHAQPACRDPVLAEWDLAPAGCTPERIDGYMCSGARVSIEATAARAPVGGLDCATVATFLGGDTPNVETCEVVDGVALVTLAHSRVWALRAHPESGRVIRVQTWDDDADVPSVVRSIAPRLGTATAPACVALDDGFDSIDLVVPSGAWTERGACGFECGTFTIRDPDATDRWLRLERWGGVPVMCGPPPAAASLTFEIDDIAQVAEVRGDEMQGCIPLYAIDSPDERGVFVRFPSSPDGTAFATAILHGAHGADGWTLSSFRPRLTLRRWSNDVRVRAGLVVVTLAAITALVIARRRRARR